MGLEKKQNFHHFPENKGLKWDNGYNNGKGMTNANVDKVMCLAGRSPVLIALGSEKMIPVEMLTSRISGTREMMVSLTRQEINQEE